MFPLARIQFPKFAAVDLEAQGDHPLRAIRSIVSEALALFEGELAALYVRIAGRRSPRRSCFGRSISFGASRA